MDGLPGAKEDLARQLSGASTPKRKMSATELSRIAESERMRREAAEAERSRRVDAENREGATQGLAKPKPKIMGSFLPSR